MMLRKRGERGEGQLGCLVGIVLLLLGALVAYKMIPIKVKAAEMRDTVKDESKSAGTHTDQRIMKAILATADRLELPVTEKDVKIRRVGTTMNIDVTYTVPVEFPGYTYQWTFHHSAENPIF